MYLLELDASRLLPLTALRCCKPTLGAPEVHSIYHLKELERLQKVANPSTTWYGLNDQVVQQLYHSPPDPMAQYGYVYTLQNATRQL